MDDGGSFYFDVSMTIAPLADAVLTIEQNALDAYRQMGLQHVYYVPIPVNQRLLRNNLLKPLFTQICF